MSRLFDVVAGDAGDHAPAEAVAAGGHPRGDRDRVHTRVRAQVELAAGLADPQFRAVGVEQRGARNKQRGSIIGVQPKRADQAAVHGGRRGGQLGSHRVAACPAGACEQVVVEVDDAVGVAVMPDAVEPERHLAHLGAPRVRHHPVVPETPAAIGREGAATACCPPRAPCDTDPVRSRSASTRRRHATSDPSADFCSRSDTGVSDVTSTV